MMRIFLCDTNGCESPRFPCDKKNGNDSLEQPWFTVVVGNEPVPSSTLEGLSKTSRDIGPRQPASGYRHSTAVLLVEFTFILQQHAE